MKSHSRPERGTFRGRRALLSILAIVLAVTYAIPGAAVAHPSSTVSAHTVLSGTVTRDGRPVNGADVLLIAWPNDESLDALQAGEPVDAAIVARAKADRRGRFAVDLDPATVGSRHTQAHGAVDLEVAVADAEHEVVWHFTASRSAPAGREATGSVWANNFVEQTLLSQRRAAGAAPTHLAVDLGTATVVEGGNEPATWVGADQRVLSSRAATERSAVPVDERRRAFDDVTIKAHNGPNCTGYVATDVYRMNRRERFGRSVGTKEVVPEVVQETTAEHRLGIAYRKGSGQWQQSGTRTTSTGAAASSHMGYRHAVFNRVNYRKWVNPCMTGSREQWRVSSFYSLNSDKKSISRPTSWTKAGCQRYRYDKNGKNEYIKRKGSNATYSSGVDLGFFSVSAKASFSHNMKIVWTVKKSKDRNGGRLCASNDKGWASEDAPQAGGFRP